MFRSFEIFAPPSRRSLFRALACGCAAATLPRQMLASDAPKTTMTSADALQALRHGNDDFVHDRNPPVAADHQRRMQIAGGQSPLAVLVGCSDSRVPPELLFSRGLGELFVIRVAGNVVDRTGLGSIEYGVVELGCPLVVVLGHERCGAVQAAIKAVTENETFPGAIDEMLAPIIPAVLRAQKQTGDLVANAVKENVRQVVHRLKAGDGLLAQPVHDGKLEVVGAYYDLDDGTVNYL